MKTVLTVFALLFYSLSYTQNNDYNVYKDAMNLIKKFSYYFQYFKDYNYKNELSVADGFYPVCVFCKTFKDEISCCEPVDDVTELFQGLANKGLKKLSDVENSKITLYFTVKENNYFVGDFIVKKKRHNTLTFLFKVENEKVILKKVIENKS